MTRIRHLADLVLDDELEALARKHGLDASLEFEKGIDWIRMNGRRYKDYQAFMRNWFRNASKYKPNGGVSSGMASPFGEARRFAANNARGQGSQEEWRAISGAQSFAELLEVMTDETDSRMVRAMQQRAGG